MKDDYILNINTLLIVQQSLNLMRFLPFLKLIDTWPRKNNKENNNPCIDHKTVSDCCCYDTKYPF